MTYLPLIKENSTVILRIQIFLGKFCSETNNVQLLEDRTENSETPAEEPAKETAPELATKGRRGRQPNSTKDDPNFRPGMSTASKGNFKSKEKRKDTMRNVSVNMEVANMIISSAKTKIQLGWQMQFLS